MERELTDQEIVRQDFVDNSIFRLMSILCPKQNMPTSILQWDIELIGKVRDKVQEVLVSDLHLCTEYEFYPFIEEEVK